MKYRIGTKWKIIDNSTHGFRIGEIITIISSNGSSFHAQGERWHQYIHSWQVIPIITSLNNNIRIL
jgi:hypothetical protein